MYRLEIRLGRLDMVIGEDLYDDKLKVFDRSNCGSSEDDNVVYFD
jgi:hypothetical protein